MTVSTPFHSNWALSCAALVCCATLGASSAGAVTGARIGDAVSIVNTVMADFDQKSRRLSKGDDVHQDETIDVDNESQGELKLDDETKLALGPGSKLLLDKFVYDSDAKTVSTIHNLTPGAFRYITGIASKPTYVINTPSASITVRGTIFDVFVFQDNTVWVLLHEGALEATGANNICFVLDQPGKLLRVASNGEVSPPLNWSQLPGNNAAPFDAAFPFVINTPQVDPTPLFTREQIIGAAFPPTPPKPCVNPHPVKVQKANLAPPPSPPPVAPSPPATQQVYVNKVAPPPYNPPVYVKPKVVYPPRMPAQGYKKHYPNQDAKNVVRGAKVIIGIGVLLGGMRRGGHHY
jgi:hypothetical protein